MLLQRMRSLCLVLLILPLFLSPRQGPDGGCFAFWLNGEDAGQRFGDCIEPCNQTGGTWWAAPALACHRQASDNKSFRLRVTAHSSLCGRAVQRAIISAIKPALLVAGGDKGPSDLRDIPNILDSSQRAVTNTNFRSNRGNLLVYDTSLNDINPGLLGISRSETG